MDAASSNPLPEIPKVLFVTHEASRTGAPMFLLHLLQWLKRETRQPFDILVRREGPLQAEFAALARVLTPAELEQDPRRLRGYGLVYSNTICNALFLAQFDLAGIPVITHVHELDGGMDTLGARSLAELQAHTSHFFACAGAVAASLQRRFGLGPDRVSVHYEMFDPVRTDANVATGDPVAVRASLGLPPDARLIVGCGTLDQRKGADLFVQGAARLLRQERGGPPLHFAWIGKASDPAAHRMLQHDIRRAGIADRLTLTGELANPHALVGAGDLFWLTSREDPFPLVMLEAAALARPLLAFAAAGGSEELCALGGGRTVPFLDVTELVAESARLLADPAGCSALGRAAAAVVRARFIPGAVAPRLWREVTAIAAAKRPAIAAGRSPVEIYATWTESELPEPAYVQCARERADVRTAARELAAAGRVRDAGLALVRGVTRMTEAKDARVLIEGLIEFGSDLAALDPARAGMLFAQAERLMGNLPAVIELRSVYQRELALVRARVQPAARARVA